MDPMFLMLFICFASYAYNRKSVVFCMPMLKAEGLDASHAGLIISCQNAAVSISKFIVGVLSDRLNPHLLFCIGLVVSGLATLVFSSSTTVTAFCFLWFLNGLAQGFGWPSIAKILRERASPSQFGTLWSFLSSGNNFAGSLGPLLSAVIIVRYGWRWNLFIAGFLSLSLCVVYIFTLPFISGNSNNTSKDKNSSSTENKDEKHSIKNLCLDPYIWLLSIGFLVAFCTKTATVDWGQIYLMEEMKHTQYVASAFTSSVETGGFFGRMVAGYLTDWAIRRSLNYSKQKSIHWKPMLRMFIAMFFVIGGLMSLHLFRFFISESSSSTWVTFVGAFIGICCYGPIAIIGIVSTECVPRHLSGTSNAIVALFGNIGATVSGLPFSYIAKYYRWSTVFLLLEILTAALILLMVLCRNLTPKIIKQKEK